MLLFVSYIYLNLPFLLYLLCMGHFICNLFYFSSILSPFAEDNWCVQT